MKRTDPFKRNSKLEEHMELLNNLLEASEKLADIPTKPQKPVILVMGCARSGTTLMTQWLDASGNFSYPSNFIARAHKSTYIASLIYQLISDPELNFRNEFKEVKPYNYENVFTSDMGKTLGITAPNVFWYFWRNYFPFGDISKIKSIDEHLIDKNGFLRGLAGLEKGFNGLPVVMKGMIANWNIRYLNKIIPKVIFIHMKRSYVYNAQSLLLSRERFYGDRKIWWSFKPPEYDKLKDLTPYEQVAGQVYYTNKAISDAKQDIEDVRWMDVNYEDFCSDPTKVYNEIKEKIYLQSEHDIGLYKGPSLLEIHNKIKLKSSEIKNIEKAYDYFSGQ